MKTREILFRGKQIDNYKWVYGYYHFAHKDEHKIYELGYINTTPYELVFGESVGQFTGLTDKNGTKIFEGDIIQSEILSKNHFISFGKSEKWGASFCVESSNSIIYLTKTWAETSIVIGNIFDNPELLQ